MATRRIFITSAAAWAGTMACTSQPEHATEPPDVSPTVPPSTLDLRELLETTPRDEVLELVAERIEQGLEPSELVVATYLAATRSISTRLHFDAPQHALLMMPSILRASQIVAPRDRWRPLLWWVDFYKWGQDDLPDEERRPMAPADAAPPVPSDRAAAELRDAVEALDGDRAERAAVALHRSSARDHVVETLLRLASRDMPPAAVGSSPPPGGSTPSPCFARSR